MFSIRQRLRRAREDVPHYGTLERTPRGVRVRNTTSGNTLWELEWDAVVEIVAYKVDAYVVDQICLAFRVASDEAFQVISEDTPGWDILQEELANHFGVRFEEWFPTVAFPAFAENWIVLWKRGG